MPMVRSFNPLGKPFNVSSTTNLRKSWQRLLPRNSELCSTACISASTSLRDTEVCELSSLLISVVEEIGGSSGMHATAGHDSITVANVYTPREWRCYRDRGASRFNLFWHGHCVLAAFGIPTSLLRLQWLCLVCDTARRGRSVLVLPADFLFRARSPVSMIFLRSLHLQWQRLLFPANKVSPACRVADRWRVVARAAILSRGLVAAAHRRDGMRPVRFLAAALLPCDIALRPWTTARFPHTPDPAPYGDPGDRDAEPARAGTPVPLAQPGAEQNNLVRVFDGR